MTKFIARRSMQVLSAAVLLVTSVTETVHARMPPPARRNETAAKSFAVFVVSYSAARREARGGVAGTAFFLGSGRALTAYHVLQASSFRPMPGFDKARVWLVHEDHAPIELKESEISPRADRDQTWIRLGSGRGVTDRFIYKLARRAPTATAAVSTDGFIAETAGPQLVWVGEDLEIVSVPRLERLHSKGAIVRKARVDLRASDVNLTGAPCLKISYRPVRGLSGGPVLSGGEVVGMNSFADPSSRAQTWAADLVVPN